MKQKMEAKGITTFDIAEYLDDAEMVTEYLNTVLEEGTTDDLLTAIGHVAKGLRPDTRVKTQEPR